MSNVGVDSYTLKMIEQVTGPLRKIEEQMERTSAGMEKLGKLATNIFAGGVIVAGIGLMGKAIGALIGVMQTGIGVASRFGSAVLQATTFRTQNITALETFLGGGRGGRQGRARGVLHEPNGVRRHQQLQVGDGEHRHERRAGSARRPGRSFGRCQLGEVQVLVGYERLDVSGLDGHVDVDRVAEAAGLDAEEVIL